MRFAGLWCAVALIACSKPKRDALECVPLPGAARWGLTAHPTQPVLFWFERVRRYDYDADMWSLVRLMRYDVRTRRLDVVTEDASPPLLFVGDKLIFLRDADRDWLALLEPDGRIQDLSYDDLDVFDVELVDDGTIALLAEGDGNRAVYLLDLARPRLEHLVDADVLLSTSATSVYVRRGDTGLAIDLKTRDRKEFRIPNKSVPNQDGLVYVHRWKIGVTSMKTGDYKELVYTPRRWKLVHQQGSVLARSPVSDDASYAWLLGKGTVRQLPTLIGGTSLLGAVELDHATWALVGHNTTNYVGDLANTDAEADVCRLPARDTVAIKSRRVPARLADEEAALFDAVAKISPTAKLQISDNDGEPMTVAIELAGEQGGTDIARMGERVRTFYEGVTKLLNDPEVRTEVTFGDLRIARYRWRRSRLRFRTSVGMGDAQIADKSSFDVELRDYESVDKGEYFTCSGTLENLGKAALFDLQVRCSDDRTQAFSLKRLDPGTPVSFSNEVHESMKDAWRGTEVFHDRQPLEIYLPKAHAHDAELFALGVKVYDATKLALLRHTVRDDEIFVTLAANLEFLKKSDAERTELARAAYEGYQALRELGLNKIRKLKPDIPLHLRIDVRGSEVEFEYDHDEKRLNRRDD